MSFFYSHKEGIILWKEMCNMEKNIVTPITVEDILTSLIRFNTNIERWSLEKISQSSKAYKLFSTSLDDHFTICLRCESEEAIKESIKYLKNNSFKVIGSIDDFGLDNVMSELTNKNIYPEDVLNEVYKKTCKYLNIDPSKKKEYSKNVNDDFFFFFYPLNEEVKTWYGFKNSLHLIELNKIAKKYHKSIDLVFSQLDCLIYGGLKLPGIAIKQLEEAYFETCNIQIDKDNVRQLYNAVKIILELVPDTRKLIEIGKFQMNYVTSPIFDMDSEDVYFDFPNEVDEKYM